MKQIVKRLMYSVAPRWTTALMSARARAHSHKVVASWGCGPLNRKLFDRLGHVVQSGPFAGLTLTETAAAEQIGPFLLGVYESELDRAWQTVFQRSYRQIIDVGAKFGYYAVGLARKYPDASVIAFDTDWWARAAVREMARANAVHNLEVNGFCSSEWLVRHVDESAFLISDCEGYEAALFTAETIARLKTATLIIETHDCLVPGVSDQLRAAFAETHDVQTFGLDGERRAPAPALDFLTDSERQLASHEVRPPQIWLLCLPRTGPNSPRHSSDAPAAAERLTVRDVSGQGQE